jgi:hypothetical protein
LDQGTYELKVVAAGFRQEMAKGIEIKADTYLDATLRVADSGSGYPVSPSPEMPLERPALAAEISLIPTQQLVLEARPLRHRRRGSEPGPVPQASPLAPGMSQISTDFDFLSDAEQARMLNPSKSRS